MFPRLFTYVPNTRCPHCHLEFEPDRGEVTGGMAINMVTTSILGLFGVFYGVFFSGLSMPVVIAGLVLIPTLFALVFHRHARGLWTGFLYATGAITEPSPAPPVTPVLP